MRYKNIAIIVNDKSKIKNVFARLFGFLLEIPIVKTYTIY